MTVAAKQTFAWEICRQAERDTTRDRINCGASRSGAPRLLFWEVNVEAHQQLVAIIEESIIDATNVTPHRRDCRILSFSAFSSVTGNVPRRAA